MSSDLHTDDKFKEKRKPKNPISFKIVLNDEQKEAKAKILRSPISIIEGRAGSGKANWIYTPVITPQGYINMGDLKKGDYVMSERGTPVEILETFPQGEQDIYEVLFSDNSKSYCTLDHLWNVIERREIHETKKDNGGLKENEVKYHTLSLEQIIDRGIFSGKRPRYFLPLTDPVQFEKKDLKLDPYIMGCLIGDGCLVSTPTITSADNYIIDYFKNYFNQWGMEVKPSCKDSISYYISYKGRKQKKYKYKNKIYNDINSILSELGISKGTYNKINKKTPHSVEVLFNPLTTVLKNYGIFGNKSYNKHIPKDYLFSSIEDRISILQGLLDTDGWVDNSKKPHNNFIPNSSSTKFCTTSFQLKEDIKFLVSSLGGTCTERERMGKYRPKGEIEYKKTRINYSLIIRFNNKDIENRLFRLERKQNKIFFSKNIINKSIVGIKKVFKDYAQCILVDSPSHLYLIDNFTVTHNTLLASQIALDLLFTRQVDQIIIARPFITAGEDIGFLPGGVDQKLEFLTFPIYDIMEGLVGTKEKIQSIQKENKIKVIPLGFLRGFTFTNSVIIIDEAQNCNKLQTELILGRLGLNSKLIFCGDKSQCDLKNKLDSGMNLLQNLSKNLDDVQYIKLIQNHRHKIVDDIFKYITENNL